MDRYGSMRASRIWEHLSWFGRFLYRKVVLASLGSFLKESGAKSVFLVTEIFGPVATDSVLNGGHYVRPKWGKSFVLWGFVTKKKISGIADNGIPFPDINMISFALIITKKFIITLLIKYMLTQKI